MKGYAIGEKPPGLAEDGTFVTPFGFRTKSVIDEAGKRLVVDVATGVLIEDESDD